MKGGILSSAVICSGGTVNSTTIDSCGSVYIYSGGTANGTLVNSDGALHVCSGGVATFTSVAFWGDLVISSGGFAESSILDHGFLFVSSGASADDVTLRNGAEFIVLSGGTATNVTAESDEAGLYITVASNTYVQGVSNGSAFELKDAEISGFTVNDLSELSVLSGGTATAIVVDSYGRLNITVAPDTYVSAKVNGSAVEMKDATLSGYTLGNADWLTIASGGMAKEIYVSYAEVFVEDGGVLSNISVGSYGSLHISSGGSAYDVKGVLSLLLE